MRLAARAEEAPTAGLPTDLAVQIEGLTVRRGGVLLFDGLDVAVPKGRVAGLLGPSGSGKTTLMRAIVGVQIIESGKVTVAGEPAGSPSLRSRVAYMTQEPSVYGDLEVSENLAYFARVLAVPDERVAAVVETVDLAADERRLVSSLSGGERARVSLAVALLADPEVLVLDEPTVGLDPVLRRRLWSTFHSLADDGKTLLVSSHVMDEAERCDYLLLMRAGELVAQEPPGTLLERTGTGTVEDAFLALVDSDGAGS